MNSYNVKIVRYTQTKKYSELTRVESFLIDAKNLRRLRKFLKDLNK